MSACSCDEWAPNIEKVNAPLMLMHARNPHQGNMYRGVPFRYCPWCGRWLEVDNEAARLRAAEGKTPSP